MWLFGLLVHSSVVVVQVTACQERGLESASTDKTWFVETHRNASLRASALVSSLPQDSVNFPKRRVGKVEDLVD